MKDRINDGGPAFPIMEKAGNVAVSRGGLSKREGIAALVLAGMNACLIDTVEWPNSGIAQKMAEVAVMQADALIAALEAPRIGAPLTVDKLDELLDGGV